MELKVLHPSPRILRFPSTLVILLPRLRVTFMSKHLHQFRFNLQHPHLPVLSLLYSSLQYSTVNRLCVSGFLLRRPNPRNRLSPRKLLSQLSHLLQCSNQRSHTRQVL